MPSVFFQSLPNGARLKNQKCSIKRGPRSQATFQSRLESVLKKIGSAICNGHSRQNVIGTDITRDGRTHLCGVRQEICYVRSNSSLFLQSITEHARRNDRPQKTVIGWLLFSPMPSLCCRIKNWILLGKRNLQLDAVNPAMYGTQICSRGIGETSRHALPLGDNNR